MDKIVAWIKNNQLAVAAIAVLLAYVAYTQFSEPKSYEECMMQVVKEARTEATARYGYTACGKMFPKPTALDLLPEGFVLDEKDVTFDDLIPKNQ